MKRRIRHATRTLFGRPPRRRPAGVPAPLEHALGLLQLSRRSAFSLALGALMLLFIGLLIANFVGQVLQSARLESRRAELEAEVAVLRAENARLEGAVDFSESDVYAERVAREQLGYAREGDTVIFLREAPPAAPAPLPDTSVTALAPLSPTTLNWRLWWQALFPPAE